MKSGGNPISDQAATKRVGQRFGDDNIDKLTNAGRVSIEINPAHVLSTSGKLPRVFLGWLLDQYSPGGADHAATDCHRLLVDSRLQ